MTCLNPNPDSKNITAAISSLEKQEWYTDSQKTADINDLIYIQNMLVINNAQTLNSDGYTRIAATGNSTNISPFRIVTLQYLLDKGLYKQKDTTTNIFISTAAFSGEPYLPVGSIEIPSCIFSSTSVIIKFVLQCIPILLVSNSRDTNNPDPSKPVFCTKKTTPVTSGYTSIGVGAGPYDVDVLSEYINTTTVKTQPTYKTPFFTTYDTTTDLLRYDILPFNTILNCCAGVYSLGLEVCGPDYYTKDTDPIMPSNKCTAILTPYCTGDNLMTYQCKEYCTRSHGYICDAPLEKFCENACYPDKNSAEYAEGTCVDSPTTRNPAFRQTCGCAFDGQFYTNWRDSLIKGISPELAKFFDSVGAVIPHCDYPDCVAGMAIRTFNDQTLCPDKNVQVCLAETNVNMGKSSNDQVNINVIENCLQNLGDEPQAPPSSTAWSPKILIISISIIIVLIMLALIGYFLYINK